jgi:hypothetical protein
LPEPRAEALFAISSQPDELACALWSWRDEYHFYMSDVGWYRIAPEEGLIEVPDGDGLNPVRREQMLWNVPSMVCFVDRGDLCLHAAAVEVDGGAVLIAAPGRHGKTTLSVAFHAAGHRLLTEDVSCIRLAPGAPVLIPGPTGVRIRADLYDGPPAGMHMVSRTEKRIQLALDDDRRGSGDPVPVRGIMLLRESDQRVHAEPVAAAAALPDLWTLGFSLGGAANAARCFEQVADLVAAVPVWNLHRPLTIETLDRTREAIVEAVR